MSVSPSGAPQAASPCTWIMYQGWRDLLFLSWPVPAPTLQALLPPGLPVDTFDGSGWVSLVPLRMQGLHLRWLPPVPGTATFGELNLRAYVRVRGEAGVYFFSIDAASRLGSLVAGRAFHLPYHYARVALAEEGGRFRFRSERTGSTRANFRAEYWRSGALAPPAPGSLEAFLLERYASFQAAPRGRLYRGRLHHSDWQVGPAGVVLEHNTVCAAAGLPEPEGAVHHFSPGTDTRVCWIDTVMGE
jgi:uncharacterized protein